MADTKKKVSVKGTEDAAKKTWSNMWHPTGAKSSKSWLITLLLCIFLGWLGGHRFYVGKIWTGILFWLCGWFIWWAIDLVRIIMGKFTDKQGNVITRK